MNKVILMGRLTADPELRQTQSGISTCRFTIAVNRKYADKNTGERQADFITCQAWRQTAEFVSRYFNKGSMIAVEGTLRTGSYQDRNHQDVTHYTTDVFVESVEFTGEKKDNQNSQGAAYQQRNNYQQPAPAAQSMVQQAQQQGIPTQGYGDLSDFEEILSDGDVPF